MHDDSAQALTGSSSSHSSTSNSLAGEISSLTMLGDVENQAAGNVAERRSVSPKPDEKASGSGSHRNSAQVSQPEQQAGFFRGRFENANWKAFAIHSTTCALIYPLLFGFTKAANGQTLFVVRLIVGLGTTTVGIAVAYTLHEFVKRFMEALTWRTMLEQSEDKISGNRNRGMTLVELSKITANPLSLLSAMRLFSIRLRIWGGKHSSQKFFYMIALFIVVVISIAGGLAFALGRTIDITTAWTFESGLYDEVPIFADLSDDPDPQGTADSFTALLKRPYLEELLRDPAPPSWRFDASTSTKMQVENETVYFTTPYSSQMRTDGVAYGSVIGAENLGVQHEDVDVGSRDDSPTAKSLLFPQWGTTIVCDRIPNLGSSIERMGTSATVMNASVVIPRDFTANLYGRLGLESPEAVIQSEQPLWFPTGSLDRRFFPIAFRGNESTPNVLTTVLFQWDNKLNLTDSGPGTEDGRFIAGWLTNSGIDGGGWTIFDVFLIRCYANFTQVTEQCAKFPLVATDFSGGPLIGYDAIACAQRTDPYIINVRNATRSVTITDVVGKGSNMGSIISGHSKQRNQPLSGSVGRNLSSSTKGAQFYEMNAFSVWLWLSRAGNMGLLSEQDKSWIAPNSSEISIPLFEDFRGVTAATSVLPLLAGNKQLVARSFKSRQIAFAHILNIPMALAIVMLFLAGVIGSFCIPKLPKSFPRRTFDVYSWMMAIQGDEMRVEDGASSARWHARMDVEEVERNFGSMRVNHPVGE